MATRALDVPVIDISAKVDVERLAIAEARISGATMVGAGPIDVYVRSAWRFLPFLHPISIGHVWYELYGDGVKVYGASRGKTGVEMDVLFGAAVAVIPSLCQGAKLEELRVAEKVKGRPIAPPQRSQPSSVPPPPPIRKGTNTYGCGGRIELGEETVRRIAEGGVEKGDVIGSTWTVVALNSKRACEVYGYECPAIYGVRPYISVDSSGLSLRVEATADGLVPCLEAYLGLLTGLLNVWDMVKKYEKDETGNYPRTRVFTLG